MTNERSEPTALIARRMRTALAEALWDPADDSAAAFEVLTAMVEGVCGRATTADTDLPLLFESEPLLSAYLFCASLQKSLNLDYLRQHPDYRETSPAEHLEHIRPHFPKFYQRQQEVLQLIDAEFPQPGGP
ncbi:hypothetical protein ABZS61_23655 [Streptomyces sp. NPDC005566]|uniref:hypothetical protein n=1 Tax=Streptomyces sp. NPDC005566 TaxID=3156886 RepID=UPI0033B3EFA7